MTNPAREALTRVINRAIDAGEWPIVGADDPPAIRIHIRGQNGEGYAVFDAAEWDRSSAVTRVLAIHAARRDLTAGQPFDVIGTERR